MDDLVRQAMAKWPNVPNCWGWLGLDARGGWYLRDDSAQAAGPFPASKGSLLRHEKLIEFIGRNYERDEHGRWYFQNGPQRVFVELEAAPLVWRLQAGSSSQPSVAAHTGRTASVKRSFLDEHGRLYLDTDIGFGIVHTLDMDVASDAVEAGAWMPEDVEAQTLPQRFGYVLSPAATQPVPGTPQK